MWIKQESKDTHVSRKTKEDPPASTFAHAHAIEERAVAQAREEYGIPQAAERVGLALSGGGVRSATFCLGVIQSLAKRDRLSKIDYLSTVSGGGYVGAWLSAWARQRQKGIQEVEAALKSPQASDGPSEPAEVSWLRQYSNYLAPTIGLLSADSMTLVATWTRNVLLNLIVVVSMLAVLILVPRLLLEPTIYAVQNLREELRFAAAWFAFFVFPLAISFNLWKGMQRDRHKRILWMNGTGGVFTAVLIPGLLIALIASVALFNPKDVHYEMRSLWVGSASLLGVASISWFLYKVFETEWSLELVRETAIFALAYAGALVVGFGLLRYFIGSVRAYDPNDMIEAAANVLTFGPPSLLLTFGASGSVLVGLVGRVYEERTREWWGRMNAWFITLGLAWLALFTLSFYVPALIGWAQANSDNWAAKIASTGWIASLATALLVPKPDSKKSTLSHLVSRGVQAAAVVAVIGFFVAVAASVWATLAAVSDVRPQPAVPDSTRTRYTETAKMDEREATATYRIVVGNDLSLAAFVAASFKEQRGVVDDHVPLAKECAPTNGQNSTWCQVMSRLPSQVDTTLFVALACVLIFIIFGCRIDVNKFSLHNMYKNRLIRCYLGASRQSRRNAHPFTGFDEDDDFALANLQRGAPLNADPAKDLGKPGRPLHIFNTALNITHGQNLAWQERKAASFTMSPYFCGYSLGPTTGDTVAGATDISAFRPGEAYRPADSWASRDGEWRGFTVGMAMATSGAAISSNRGKGTTAAMAFLATVFNARLGRWSPNPAGNNWRVASPWFAPFCLVQELFGYSNETSKYIHLSDGGHFDNTGVYELVRRKCRVIIAVDATADLERSLSDLANLIRKCRVDLGARIQLPLAGFHEPRKDSAAAKGYVFGTIDYGDGQPPAQLIVLKPTLIELAQIDVDVFSYSLRNNSFPHQSTVDQFFDESQFESYRALGECIARVCLEDPDCRLTSEARQSQGTEVWRDFNGC